MAQSSIFIIQELLEQILHFLAIDKSLYPTLYISQLWYRCGAPILWKRVELNGNGSRSRLKKFIKLVCRKQKPVYSSNLTHLKISYYDPLLDKKINDIVCLFLNIIYLDFDNSIGFSDKALNQIAESYPNLKYLNLRKNKYIRYHGIITDKGLCAIARSCHKLEYLNISHYTVITNITIEEIASSCLNLKYLDLEDVIKLAKKP